MNGQSTPGKSDRQDLVRHIQQEHHEILHLFLLGLCRRYGYDATYAQDLLQDFYYLVMLRYETFAPKYDQHGISYLYSSLRNLQIDLSRKERSFKRLENVFAQQVPQVGNIYNLSPDNYTEQFYEMLEKLLPPHYYSVMKAYIEGFSYEEISEQYHLPKGTVGTYIHRAKKILKNYLSR